MIPSETAELRYRHVWEMFEKELTTNYRCSLSEIAAKNRTDLTGMRSWMLEHGLSVSRLKKEILHRYYGGSIPNAKNAERMFAPIVAFGIPREVPSLLGIRITFNSGTIITVKEATAEGLTDLIRIYERKDGESCIF